jgi:hypothetical protein
MSPVGKNRIFGYRICAVTEDGVSDRDVGNALADFVDDA